MLQLFTLGNLNILRNGLLHRVVCFLEKQELKFSGRKYFVEQQPLYLYKQQPLQLLISVVRYGETALVPICCDLSEGSICENTLLK